MAYAIISSIFLGGLVGFLIVYPFLQILIDKLGINYGYDDPQWIHYLIYAIVVLFIIIFICFNKRRYVKHVQIKKLM